MAKDYYRTLGVNRNADEAEIKKAFRRLAKQYHPDANPDNPGAEAKFKELNEAYEVLGDPEKRAQYDRFGEDFRRYQQPPGGPGGQYPYSGSDANGVDFDDLLRNIFGGFGGGRAGNPRTAAARGRDIEQPVTISLREAYEGATRFVSKGDRRIKADIPAGIADAMKVRLAGEGEPGIGGGAPGDLYLVVQIEPDSRFERKENDLYTEVRVDLFSALLGGAVEVPTLDRPVRLNIPAGTQSGQRFRLTGKGMPIVRQKGQFGDLFARVFITVPTNLTDAQREKAEQFRKSLGQ